LLAEEDATMDAAESLLKKAPPADLERVR
jgi:hypothetical protein